MGAPAIDIADIDFDDPDDPDVAELTGTGIDNAPPEDDSDLFDAPPANDNAQPAATPEQVAEAKRRYLQEHPEEVPALRDAGVQIDDPAQQAPASALDHLAQAGKMGAQSAGDALSSGASSLWDLAKRGSSAFSEGTRDAFRGLGQGVTLGWGDELAASLTPEVDDGTGIPRTYAAGSAYADARNAYRDDNAQAQERSPYLYGGGEVLGAAATTTLATPAVAAGARGASLGGRVLSNMAQGGIAGGAAGGGYSEADDALGVTRDAAQGAVLGGGLGGGITAASGLGAQGLRKLAAAAKPAADRWRGAAAGGYGGELSKLAERHGDEYVGQLGRDIERLGLHKRPGSQVGHRAAMSAGGSVVGAGLGAYNTDDAELARDPNARLANAGKGAALGALGGFALSGASTPSVYRDNAKRVAGEMSEKLGGAIDDATAQGVTVPKQDLIGKMRQVLKEYGTDTPEDEAMRAKVSDLIRRVDEKHGAQVTPQQLQKLKKKYETRAGFKPTRNTPQGDADAKEMYRKLASAPRTAMGESMEQLALPETADQFARSKQDFGIAKQVHNMARKRAAQEAGNQAVSLPSAATGSVLGGAAIETGKRVGRDVGADVLRGTERGSNALAQLAEGFTGAPVGTASGVAQGHVPRLQQAAAAAQPPPAAQPADLDYTQTLGHVTESKARALLQQNPQALGKHSAALLKAMESDEPAAFSAELYKASHDKDFRTRYLPTLQQGGAR